MRDGSRAHKIFGIGLSGTGTHSLVAALKILGYRTKHYPKRYEQFDEYDALADIPVSARFEFLDQAYPNSRFILTTRELEGWLENRKKKKADVKARTLWVLEARFRLYGQIGTAYIEDELIRAYHRHHESVKNYFADRPGDLLTLNIVNGEGWDRLCPFLGHAIPDLPFPRVSSEKKRRKGLINKLLPGK